MSAAKAKGTRAETAVVDFLRSVGFKHAERRALRGVNDAGDIAGIPGLVIEVKDDQYRMELSTWVDEAMRESKQAFWAVVWHKRRGKSSPGDWYVTMTGVDFAALLLDAIEPEA